MACDKANVKKAYCGKKLKQAAIPNGITMIANAAFANCEKLTSVTIPNTVKVIGNAAFAGCSALTSITIPDSVEEIGNAAFAGCSELTQITIPKSVKMIGKGVFAGCTALQSIVVDVANTVYISAQSNAIIDRNTKTLIAGCANTSIPNDVEYIGMNAFEGGSLANITFPANLKGIGQSAFRNCKSLQFVNIPNMVQEIGYWAFAHCDSLTQITIPPHFTSIGKTFDGSGVGVNGQVRNVPLRYPDKVPMVDPIRIDGNNQLIDAIEILLKGVHWHKSNNLGKSVSFGYLLNQSIRQYQPDIDFLHVSKAAKEKWFSTTPANEDIRKYEHTAMYSLNNGKRVEFNKTYITEHTICVSDIIDDLVSKSNILRQDIANTLDQIHLSRILKTEDDLILKISNRGLDFEAISNGPLCYLGAGIEFQCSQNSIGYEAFKGCKKLSVVNINNRKLSVLQIADLIQGKLINLIP